MIDEDLEGHPLLALDRVVGTGEEVVRPLARQRHGDHHRLPELVAASAVLGRVVRCVVHAAALVGRVVGGLDHRLIRICVEYYTLSQIEKSKVCLVGQRLTEREVNY